MKTLLTLILAGFVFTQSVFATSNLSVVPNKYAVALDEPLSVTITAEFATQDDALDTAGITDDFDIVSRDFSTHTHLINLQHSASSVWELTLLPRRQGSLVIPPLSVGSAESSEIVVQAAPTGADTQASRDIKLETTLVPASGYLQQPFVYTLSVYHSAELSGEQLEINFPDTLIVTPLPTERLENRFYLGRRFDVIHYRYMIIPQTDGVVSLPPASLNGTLRERNRGSFGKLYVREETFSINGPSIEFDVLPPVDAFTGQWLTAESLALSLEWISPPNEAVVGQPTTVSINIEATGTDGATLPDVNWPLPPTMRVYKDKPNSRTTLAGRTLLANKSMVVAIVPEQTGQLTLPAISLPWFNTRTQTVEMATLPATSLEVSKESGPSATSSSTAHYDYVWPSVTAALLCYGFITTVIIFRRSYLHRQRTATADEQPSAIPTAALIRTLERQSPRQAITSLTDYLSVQFDKKQTLEQHSAMTENDDLQLAISDLYAYVYGSQGDRAEIMTRLVQALRTVNIGHTQSIADSFFRPNRTH